MSVTLQPLTVKLTINTLWNSPVEQQSSRLPISKRLH